MPTFDIEYALAVFQRGIFTFAAKEHRRAGGAPTLSIIVHPAHVEWIVAPLTQGAPDTNDQAPQKDRADLYFLLANLQVDRAHWPNTTAAPATWYPAPDNRGTERSGGRTIKMVAPLGRVAPVSGLIAAVGLPSNPFTVAAQDLVLFMDIEYTPKGQLYPASVPQLHIGFQGNYVYSAGATALQNEIRIQMSHPVYQAIRNKIFVI